MMIISTMIFGFFGLLVFFFSHSKIIRPITINGEMKKTNTLQMASAKLISTYHQNVVPKTADDENDITASFIYRLDGFICFCVLISS